MRVLSTSYRSQKSSTASLVALPASSKEAILSSSSLPLSARARRLRPRVAVAIVILCGRPGLDDDTLTDPTLLLAAANRDGDAACLRDDAAAALNDLQQGASMVMVVRLGSANCARARRIHPACEA